MPPLRSFFAPDAHGQFFAGRAIPANSGGVHGAGSMPEAFVDVDPFALVRAAQHAQILPGDFAAIIAGEQVDLFVE